MVLQSYHTLLCSLLAIFCTFVGWCLSAVKLGYEYFNIGSDDSAYKLLLRALDFLFRVLSSYFFIQLLIEVKNQRL